MSISCSGKALHRVPSEIVHSEALTSYLNLDDGSYYNVIH